MKFILTLSLVLLSSMLYAQKGYKKEINYLLDVINTTECMYERNGDVHSGVKAVKHIQRKYDYFKDDIYSAEDFIDLSANKSTISGRKYKILCEGKAPVESKKWLLEKLKEYRLRLAQ